ncbi:putative diguanylate cyclase YegE [Pandoraea terrae]|uniref:Putative diguanylate cyclase YegE n=1 Tax=Pandoraea terrae TaxID=1537710 RepID=A0A5E4VRE4_9BURK|nr:diguanylate cyclase [Pandoraea terrae]VVE14811.1 putative diguanylate cyclase YegE [Pandoraea terrae]
MIESLKGRVALKTALVSMVLIAGVAFGIEFFVYGELRDSLQAQLDTQVRLVSDQLDDKVRGKFLALQRMAHHVAGRLDMTPAQMQAFASASVSMPETFNTIFIASPDGRLLFDSTFPKTPLNVADRDYFKRVMAGAPQAISGLVAGKITGAPGVVLAVPVHGPNGEVSAVIGGAVNLLRENFIIDLATSHVGSSGRYCLLTDETPSRYVMHSDLSMLVKPAADERNLCGADTTGSSLLVSMRPLVARADMATTHWALVAVLPGVEAFSPLTKVRQRVALLAGVAIALTAFVMWWVARGLLRPLDTLRDLVQRSSGDLRAVEALPVQRADEIGALANEFRQLMLQLGDHTDALESSRESARANARRMQQIADRVPYLVMFLDAHERFAFVNRACELRLKRPRGRIVGETVQALLGGDMYAVVGPHLARAYQGESATFHWEHGSGDEYHCFEASYQPEWVSGHVLAGVHVFVRDITIERSNERRWRRESHTDHLTGLLNRKGFDNRLTTAMRRARDGESSQALLLVDLDRFKAVNDTYGHSVGDELLRRFAKRLATCVRSTDAIARFGGDEFAIVMTDVGDPRVAERAAVAILDAASRPMALSVGDIAIGACVGVTFVPAGESKTAGIVFDEADRALYGAKHSGRGIYLTSRDLEGDTV